MSCSVSGCTNSMDRRSGARRGMCGTHYQRWMRHGQAEREPWLNVPVEWIKSHVQNTGDECLDWPFGLDTSGYGRISLKGIEKSRKEHAHRYMCLIANGSPPTESHQAAHSCGRRQCCNPRHLSWKTQIENEADKLIHGTALRGERSPSAKLTKEDVIYIRSAKNMTQKELAKLFGVSRGHIAGLRTGRFWPEI